MAALPYIGFDRLLSVAVELCGGLEAGVLRGNRMEERLKERTKNSRGLSKRVPSALLFFCLKLWRLRCGLTKGNLFYLLRVHCDKNKCVRRGTCLRSCPTNVEIHRESRKLSHFLFACFRSVSACFLRSAFVIWGCRRTYIGQKFVFSRL